MNIFELYGKIDISDTEAIKKIEAINNKAKQMDKSFEGVSTAIGSRFNRTIDGMVTKANQLNTSLISGLSKSGSAMQSVGSSLTSKITKPALAATTALTGITLVKGFDRLVGIDSARAKLRALKFDGKEVDQIMNNALESVKGTSYGMAEAATTAANAVAAGIKPGQDLTKYLKMTADAASIAGVSMGEMGSIVNKVQTGGRAMTENLEQLADRGLPVYQWLAKEAGVSADAVKDLASKGEISSEMFFKAIEKNVGGAAGIIGSTSFKGAFANIGASLSRIGANFLDAGGKGGGFFSQLKPLMVDFSTMLEKIEGQATKWGEAFGKAFADMITKVKEVKAQFDSLDQATQDSITKSIGIGAAVAVAAGPVISFIGTVTSAIAVVGGGIASLMGVVTGVTGAMATVGGLLLGPFTGFATGLIALIPGVGGAMSSLTGVVGSAIAKLSTLALAVLSPAAIVGLILVALGAANMAMGGKLDEMITTVMEKGPAIIQGLIEGIQSTLPQLMEQGTAVLAAIGEGIALNLPAIMELATTLITGLVDGVTAALPTLIPIALDIITALATGFITNLPALIIAGLDLIQGLITGIIENIPKIAESAMTIVKTLGESISTNMPIIIEKGVKILTSLVQGITQMIPQLLPVALKLITTIITGITQNLPNIIAGGIKILNSLITGISQMIPQLIPMAMKMIVTIVTAIIANLPQIFAGGVKIIGALIEGLVSMIGAVIQSTLGVVKSIWETFTKTDWGQVGHNVIAGIGQGLANAGHMLWDSVKGVLGSFKDNVLSFFGIHSPSRWGRDEVGRWIPQGIAVGIEKDGDSIQESMDEVARALTFDPDLDSNLAYSVDGGSFTSSRQVELQNQQEEVNKEILEVLYALLEKDQDIILDGDSLVQKTRDRMSKALNEQTNQQMRGLGLNY